MIDKFDYAEPECPLSGGKDFYYPDNEKPLGRIPTGRIIGKIDSLFSKNDYKEAGRLLTYWRGEAIDLKDKHGELSMENELIGYYRKQADKENALASCRRALELMKELNQDAIASGATILINCATAYKAFGMAEDAVPLYVRAKEIYEKTLPEGDSRFGGLYNNMALALADIGKTDEAEKAYMSALSVMEKVENGEADAAITYVNMAYLYEAQGNILKMNECMKKAYKLLKTESLPHDGYYAFVLEKCAPAFEYFGNKGAYEEFKKESEEIYARN